MLKKITILLFLGVTKIALSQKSDSFLDTKHQLGVNVSRLVNSVFPSDKNAFLLHYRNRKNDAVHYRTAMNYEITTGEVGNFTIGAKIGVDRGFKSYGNWYFYYGLDIGGNYNYVKESKRYIIAPLLIPFLGIQYKFSKYFSVSTEPGVFFKYNYLIDNGSFALDANKQWFESAFSNVGILQLNVHF